MFCGNLSLPQGYRKESILYTLLPAICSFSFPWLLLSALSFHLLTLDTVLARLHIFHRPFFEKYFVKPMNGGGGKISFFALMP